MPTQHDQLFLLLRSIETQCAARNIALFHGEIEENAATEVLWTEREGKGLEQYVELLLHTTSNILIVSVDIEDADYGSDPLILEYKGTLTGDALQAHTAALAELEWHKGHVSGFTLSFFQGGICYRYEKEADWMGHHLTIHEAYESDDTEDEEESNALSESEIEAAAQSVTQDPTYQLTLNYHKRIGIARDVLEKEGITNYTIQIQVAKAAEDLFVREVLPRLDGERRKQVQTLKGQGLSKVATKAKLGFTETMLNKYWY